MPQLRKLLAIVLALAPMLIVSASQAQQAGPEGVVERLHASLMEAMRNADALGFGGRARLLQPVLAASYDYGAIARAASGSHWRRFTEEQRREVTRAFAQLSLANYAARFDGYSGQRFVTLGSKPTPDGGTLVQTRLVQPGDEDVRLDYLLRPTDEGWQIVDVFYMGGVSEVANQRSQFLSILRSQGFEGLMAALRRKTAEQAPGGAGRAG